MSPIVEQLRHHVRQQREAMVQALTEYIRIPSVNLQVNGRIVPSPETLRALHYVMDLSGRLGMPGRVLDDVVGVAACGPVDAAETVAVLSHADVVPADTGWTYPPFEARLVDGAIYGRGAEDDKGPAISALFGLQALQALRVPMRRKVHFVVGSTEEGGDWSEVGAYCQAMGAPTLGFTPDAQFPAIYGEKGSLRLTFAAQGSAGRADAAFVCVGGGGGTVPNAVPSWAWAALVCSGREAGDGRTAAQAALDRYTAANPQARLSLHTPAEFKERFPQVGLPACDLVLEAVGQTAHSAHPEAGHNALIDLAGLLAELEVAPNALGQVARFVAYEIGADYHGERLNVACRHPDLGQTTVNVSILNSAGRRAEMVLNIRFVFPQTAEEIGRRVAAVAGRYGLKPAGSTRAMGPLLVDVNDPLIVALSTAFRTVTGQDLPPTCIAGSTYAKAFARMVAFGPLMPGEPGMAHEVDEHTNVDALVRNAEIYAVALYGLTQ